MQSSSNRFLLCSERMKEGKKEQEKEKVKQERYMGNGKESKRETGKPRSIRGGR